MQLLSSRRRRAVAAGAAALAIALSGCTAETVRTTYSPPPQVEGELPAATLDPMKEAVSAAMSAAGASGAIVGVWAPWGGSWVAGVGTQGPGGEEVTADMSFRIADVTRLMTCDVLYGLADDGVVELDAKVPDYVSGVANLSDITLLDLCNGTSGAGSSEATVKSALLNTPDREWSPLELAGYGLSRPPVAPHTTYRDSDAGYLLLGLALERASGLTASELIAEYVAEPLGLRDTALPGRKAAPPSNGPVMNGHHLPAIEGGYDCSAPIDITTISASSGFTDSGAVSTIEDLGRYMRAEAAQLLRAEDKRSERYSSPLPASANAPSWFQATGGAYLAGSLVGQFGWTPGYATAAFADPETGLTVAVVLNDSTQGGSHALYLAWELAALASKAPAASGQTAPQFGLPFTAEQYHQTIADTPLACAAPVE